MCNIMLMKIFNSCNQLLADASDLVHMKRMLILLHISAHIPTERLHYQMEFVISCVLVVFSHEVFVLDDVRMI